MRMHFDQAFFFIHLALKKTFLKFVAGNIGSNAIQTGIVRSLAIPIVLVFSLVLAKLLGATDYGVFAFNWSWLIVLATVAAFGTDVLVVREISREEGGAAAAAPGIVKWSLSLIALSSVAVIVAALVLRDYFAQSPGAATTTAFYVVLPCIPLLASVRLLQGVLQAHGKSAASQLPQFVLIPLITLLIVTSFHLAGKLSVVTAFVSMLLAMVGSLLWGTLYYLKNIRKADTSSADIPAPGQRGWLAGTAALGVVGVASMANEQIGVILLGSFGFAESAGAFDIIRKMAIVVALGLMMVNVPLAPVIARKLASNEIGSLQSEIKSAVRFASLVALAIAVMIVVFGKFVLGLLNPNYTDVYPALLILLAGQLINVASGPVWLILNMAGLVRYAAIGLVAGAVANIVISLLLLPDYGVAGVAVGTVTGLVLWNLIQLYFIRKNLAINASIL